MNMDWSYNRKVNAKATTNAEMVLKLTAHCPGGDLQLRATALVTFSHMKFYRLKK